MQNRRRIFFPAPDPHWVVTFLTGKGEYGAYLEDSDQITRGYGYNEFSAIADLNRRLEERAEWEGENMQEAAE